MTDLDTSRRARWTHRDSLWILALTLAAVVIFAQGYQHQFVAWDDELYVSGNYRVRQGLSWDNIVWAFSGFVVTNYHPLTMVSHMADVSLWGAWAGGHVLTNLFWHALNGALLFVALRTLTGRRDASGLVAALFVVHPLHVESVAWVSERKDLLCGFFWILAMWLYATYARRPSLRRYLAVTVAVALSLLSKPMAVTLPVALLCLDIWPLRRFDPAAPIRSWLGSQRQVLLEKLPWLAMAAALALLTVLAQERAMPTQFDAGSRYLNVIVSYGAYLYRTVWPFDLQFFYSIERILSVPSFALSFLAVFGLSLWVWQQRTRRPYLLAGWAWFVLTLVPVVGIVKVGTQAYADRYTYLPLIGLFWMLVWGASEYFARPDRSHTRRPVAALALALLVGLSFLSWRQTGTWRDSGTLYKHGLALDPENYVALQGLGYWAFRNKEYAKAIDYSEQALKLAWGPSMIRAASVVMGDSTYAMGNYDQALQHYQNAVAAEEDMAHGAHLGLGLIMMQRGDFAAAERSLRRAIELQPNYSYALNNLGIVLYRQGRMDESLTAHREAARLDPGNVPAHFNLAQRLEQRGNVAGAVAQIETLLRLFPNEQRAATELARLKGRLTLPPAVTMPAQ